MLERLHIVRHGEVHNPDHVVYADLPGFGLSSTGATQARAAGRYLRDATLDIIWTSPLERAVATAAAIAEQTGTEVASDERLTEWKLGKRWAGVVWEDLPDRFPGELEAYLATPTDLDFAPESISEVAARMTRVVADLGTSYPGAAAAVVSHQDPVQALRLVLTGRSLEHLNRDKPGHACVTTLEHSDAGWIEAAHWCPDVASMPFPPVNEPTET